MRKDRIDEERFAQDSCTTNDDDRGGTGTTENEWNEEDEERYRNSRSQLHAYARHVIKSDQADERYKLSFSFTYMTHIIPVMTVNLSF